jgi:hypothetical protein
MHLIQVSNVNHAYRIGMAALRGMGREVETRNGPALKFEGPVTTLYENPMERVLFNPVRDANPFFHFYEGLWMILGRNDVAGPSKFVSRMANYSDDGATFHGAYGYRWRKHFGFDQLALIITVLTADPTDRRCVLQMWDGPSDLGKVGKDFPCNTQIYFNRNNEGKRLDMMVTCRSNDLIWGAYGANAVHFSMLQEFVAGMIGCPVGKYWQVSNDMHAYRAVYDDLIETAVSEHDDPYSYAVNSFRPISMFEGFDSHQFYEELKLFMDHDQFGALGIQSPYLKRVAGPLLRAHKLMKARTGEQGYREALTVLHNMEDCDWKFAAQRWILRRLRKLQHASDDGVTYQ